MNEGRVPDPRFDTRNYERPNKNWVCGHAARGCPCRIGPSPKGKCRATTECVPELDVRPGETKGTWKCTRPKDWGGACKAGPLPDGTCCHVIPKCQPVRSILGRRALVTRGALVAAAGVMVTGLVGSMRETFINPGAVSLKHSGPKFTRLAADQGGGQGCVLCHAEAHASLGEMFVSATRASGDSLHLTTFVASEPKDFSRMDRACEECHRAHDFHEANVPRDKSCSICHREHRGRNVLLPVAEQHCTACHGDAREMAAAEQKGRELATDVFPRKTAPGIVTHSLSRPAGGYTRLIHGFASDHPEFQLFRDTLPDTNTLKFNHHVHLTSAQIPPVEGKRLDCAYCHQPDASGAFMQRITFERNCRACHALNFDENNPAMTLPHGDPALVRAYLASLPTNYADFATRQHGLTRREEIQAFVLEQMRALRTRTQSGEDLEHAIFFSDLSVGEAAAVAGQKGPARAKFSGCATCHEVTPRDNLVPTVTAPKTPDRWMVHARFNHKAHATIQCTDCHAAAESSRTSDIIIPTQKSCVECHGPKGNVRHDCGTCHNYHNELPSRTSAPGSSPPLVNAPQPP